MVETCEVKPLVLLWMLTTCWTPVMGGDFNNSMLFSTLRSKNYDDIPPTTNKTQVNVDFYVNGLSDVKISSMSYWIDVFLTQEWKDSRLKFNESENKFISLPDSLIPKLWVPDLYLAQAKQGKVHSITDASKVIRLNPSTGTLLCSQRIQAELACTMNLKYFPFDKQMCDIRLESWRYERDLVTLEWLTDSFDGGFKNVKVDQKLSQALPSLAVDTSANKSGNCSDEAREDYSCLSFHVTFYRDVLYYIGDIYMPSLLMVIVTWMSFWIDRKVIQGRCALGSLTMVAISNQINSVKQVLPPTAEIKAADIWLWTCQFYVLAAFLEFGLVNFLSRRDLKNSASNNQNQTSAEENTGELEDPESDDTISDNHNISKRTQASADNAIELQDMTVTTDQLEQEERPSFGRWSELKRNVSKKWKRWCAIEKSVRVDLVSRAFFPGTFTLFTLIYWAHFLRVSEYDATLFSDLNEDGKF